MSMTIRNDPATMRTLGLFEQNTTELGKQLKKVSTGMKINSAGDAASDFAISERMRVRLRALNQNNTNVQNGASLLHVAEGGIQQQIDIMRTIKQKVIDAANDTNTDNDRATIQKEINQGYDQIDDIAYETTYNGKRVLMGNSIQDQVFSWRKKMSAETVVGTAEMNVIADAQEITGDAKLSGDPAKYDKLSGYQLNSASVLGVTDSTLSGGVNYKAAMAGATFSATSTSALKGKGLKVTVTDTAGKSKTYGYVFATDSTKYKNINGATKTTTIRVGANLAATYSKLANQIQTDLGITATVGSGSNPPIQLTGKTTTKSITIVGANATSGSGTTGTGALGMKKTGTNQVQAAPKVATTTIDLSAYDNTTSTEDFINQLTSDEKDHKGQALKIFGNTYEFYDSKDGSYELNTAQKIAGSTMVDLNDVRTGVAGGKNVSAAFVDLMAGLNSNVSAESGSTAGSVTGLIVSAPVTDPYSVDNTSYNNNNSFTVRGYEASLSSYDIDYASWFQNSKPSGSLSEYLNDKGFRFYANGTDDTWYNVTFTDGKVEDQIGDRPKSGTGTQNITTMVVDVRKVQSAKDLVNAIVDQTKDKMPSNYRWSKDADKGLLTLYDTQRSTNMTSNEKIADGAYDNVVVATRNSMVEDVNIQDSDTGSQYTHCYVPKTSLDHIFGFAPGDVDVKTDYSVATKDMRDTLLGMAKDKRLGTGEKVGYLDRALNYLLDASTLVGAQTMRMQYNHANIVTMSENEQSSESTIRDADMAKEMTEYTKTNILMQSSQAMLAQANQSNGNVLSLLQ